MPTQFPTIPQHEQQRFPPEQQEGQQRSQQRTTEISPKTPLLQTSDTDPRSTPSKSTPHPYVSAQPSIIYNHQIQQYSPGYPPVPMIGPYQINYQSTSSQNNSSSYPAYLTYGSTASNFQQEDPNLQRQLSYQYNTSGNSYDNLASKASSISTETGAIGTESSAENSPETKSLSLKTKKPRGNRTAGYCDVCKKNILRDLKRHMRIHEDVKRFVCVYPKDCCVHKTGTFNRNYDFKKHLLHTHFEFDDPLVKKLFGLNEKLSHTGNQLRTGTDKGNLTV